MLRGEENTTTKTHRAAPTPQNKIHKSYEEGGGTPQQENSPRHAVVAARQDALPVAAPLHARHVLGLVSRLVFAFCVARFVRLCVVLRGQSIIASIQTVPLTDWPTDRYDRAYTTPHATPQNPPTNTTPHTTKPALPACQPACTLTHLGAVLQHRGLIVHTHTQHTTHYKTRPACLPACLHTYPPWRCASAPWARRRWASRARPP